MGSSFFQLLFLFAFFLEIVNPSTSFVREQVGPVKSQKVAKMEKKISQQNPQQKDSTNQDASDDDDYVTSGAIMPSHNFASQPYVLEGSLHLHSTKPPQLHIHSIHRPPESQA